MEANRRLVIADRLDGRRDLDLALVDLAETGGRDAAATSEVLTEPNRRPPRPALTVSLTLPPSSLALSACASSSECRARAARAA